MEEFKFVGSHADELENGRPIEPGEYTGPINERAKKNKQLIDEGMLLPVEAGTAKAVAELNAAAAPSVGEADGEDDDEKEGED